MRIPWGAPTVSDATKLGLAKNHGPAFAGVRLYQLLLQTVFTDDFADFTNWTEVDSGGNVSVSGGVVSMNGSGSDTTNGLYKTVGVARSNGICFECKMKRVNANIIAMFALHSSGALTATPAGGIFRQNNTVFQMYEPAASGLIASVVATADAWYTVRHYMGQTPAGSWTVFRTTIEGGTEYPTETELCATFGLTGGVPATIYPILSRRTTNAVLSEFKEFRIYSGFATDSPYLKYVADAGRFFGVSDVGTMAAADYEDPEAGVTGAVTWAGGATGILRGYNSTTGKANIHTITGSPAAGTVTCTATGHTFTVSDAGVQCYFDGFDFSRFKAVGGWATTNATFKYTVDGGALSAAKTLAQLQAVGKIAGPYRVELYEYANSDGATQQYAGELNADNGCGMPTAEAHTANQVLKSAGGNWDDDNLGIGDEGNVASGVAFGLSQTGTMAAAGTYYTYTSGAPVIQSTVPVVLGVTETTIYTCPSNTTALVRLTLCNTGSSARTATIHKVLSGESAGDATNSIKKTIPLAIAGADGDDWVDCVRTLEAGDKISALASAANVVIAQIEVIEVPVTVTT